MVLSWIPQDLFLFCACSLMIFVPRTKLYIIGKVATIAEKEQATKGNKRSTSAVGTYAASESKSGRNFYLTPRLESEKSQIRNIRKRCY